VLVGVRALPADPTAKRLLVWPVLAGHMMTSMTFLGTVGALDLAGTQPAFGCPPGPLLGDMGQVGGVQVRVHPPRLKAHARPGRTLISNLRVRVIAVQCVDGAIEFLPDVP